MAKEKGRSPDWDLNYFNKATERAGQVGVAWNNPDGSITVRLNPCVHLPNDDDQVLTMFRRKPKPQVAT